MSVLLLSSTLPQVRKRKSSFFRSDLLAVAFHGGELVLVDHLGVVQQPADERALAVVDAAAGQEAQKLLLPIGTSRCRVSRRRAGPRRSSWCRAAAGR